MEEDKAAAYYDELTRKGERAARFKQGLGFSSQSSDTTTDNTPARGSALPSSSAFLSSFVRASSPGKTAIFEKQAQLESIQNKLKKKQSFEHEPSVSEHRSRNDLRRSRPRSSSREKERDRHPRRRSRSRDGHDSRRRYRSSSRERDGDRRSKRRRRSRSESHSDEERIDRKRTRDTRRRSRSRSYSDEERRRPRGSRERKGREKRSRSSSPQRSEKSRSDGCKGSRETKNGDEKSGGIDYSRLIFGYAEMTAVERVKAKMKLQLKQAAEKDSAMGNGVGWERFEFNKDAPLDEEEMEGADDDKVLVKHIGQSFRFSAVEARREEEIKTAHDEAMFGAPRALPPVFKDEVPTHETEGKEGDENSTTITDLLSDKVLAKQQGSWRDRARKPENGRTN